jgi:hypothetical protein
MKHARIIVLLVCVYCTGCGLSSHKAALPKQAGSEAVNDYERDWTLAVQGADIIYFPVETIGAVSGEDSAAKIVQALKNTGTPFAVAWQGIEPDDGDQTSPSEPRWSYTGKLREQCKMVMRDTIEARQLFLGLPRTIRAKLQSGSVLASDERRIIPRDYRIPAGGLENFAEQLATVRGLQERDIENLYRAHVVAGQFAAEKIVAFMREDKGEKLLVFARRRELIGDCALPAFVSQKLRVRQITFDRDRARNTRPRLVSSARNIGRLSRL